MSNDNLTNNLEINEIRLRHSVNDLYLTKTEFEEATSNYLETVAELEQKNKKLVDLQRYLEKRVEERTAEIRKIQEILQTKGEEQQIILDSSPTMIYYLDRNNCFSMVNLSFAKFFNMTVKKIIGRTDVEIFGEFAEVIRLGDDKILEEGISQKDIHVEIVNDNKDFWLEIDKSPYKDTEGNILGVLGFVTDITEKVFLEKQLYHAEKLSTVGRLVAGVAHELNNPLSIVSGYSQLIQQNTDLDPGILKMLEKVVHASKRCANIVENLLKFSRKTDIQLIQMNINTVLDEALKLTENTLKLSKIKLNMDVPDFPDTMGDKNQILSVFVNLISNSIDALEDLDKEGVINISAKVIGNIINFEFSDNGPGISEKNANKIFDPFYTSKEVGKGTGLGLSICYGIILEHGGDISLDRKFKDGTLFYISLPLTLVDVKKEESSEVPRAGIKVLIIEDEEDIAEIQTLILKHAYDNIMIEHAEDGEKGIEFLEMNNFDYDLVICDMKMPGKVEGNDIFEFISRQKPDLSGKLIFVTGDITPQTKTFMSLYKIPCLNKPFSNKEYTELVKNILKKK